MSRGAGARRKGGGRSAAERRCTRGGGGRRGGEEHRGWGILKTQNALSHAGRAGTSIQVNVSRRHAESGAALPQLQCARGDGVSVRRGEATALDVRRPSGTNPLRFFSVYARNIYIQLSRRPRFFSLSRSWRPIFVSRRQRGALDPK